MGGRTQPRHGRYLRRKDKELIAWSKDQNPAEEWYWVRGWSDNIETPTCQAYAKLGKDSGADLTHLVYGGLYGLHSSRLTSRKRGVSKVHVTGESRLSH